MSTENLHADSVCAMGQRDPRTVLVKDKYFSLRPKPLERWLWQQGVPQTAERVFWLHWEEGMKSGDWCSQLPIRRVASLCCIDPSTVTRAYQLLKTLGLIRREDPGRDEANPFRQATAITEVRVPGGLLAQLARAPDRSRCRTVASERALPPAPEPEISAPVRVALPSRTEAQAMWGRASSGEKARFFQASRAGVRRIEFDADSRLTGEEQQQLGAQLDQMARARSSAPAAPKCVQGRVDIPSRRLSALELARTRRRLAEAVPGGAVVELLGQVTWAIEEGALRRFDMPLALNIALKKIREGHWSRPNRMPPRGLRAHPETCGAA